MSQPTGFSFGSSVPESAQSSSGFGFGGSSLSGSSFSFGGSSTSSSGFRFGGSSPPSTGWSFNRSSLSSGSTFGFGSNNATQNATQNATATSTPGGDQSREGIRSIGYDDDSDKLHAALAIEHNCDVSDIYRVLIKSLPTGDQPVEYFTIFRMKSVDKFDRELCRVRLIIPADILAEMNAAGVREGESFLAYDGFFTASTADTLRDIRKRHAGWARVYYQSMQRDLTALQSRLANKHSGGNAGAPVSRRDAGLSWAMIVMFSILFVLIVGGLYGAMI